MEPPAGRRAPHIRLRHREYYLRGMSRRTIMPKTSKQTRFKQQQDGSTRGVELKLENNTIYFRSINLTL
jgi:hypothetical protein